MADRNLNPRKDDLDAERDANRDPITGTPGSHPIGTGIGAAGAGAAGAAIGSVVPGVGTVAGGAVGAVVGAVAGGLAGKGVAEAVNPTDEDAYWREQFRSRSYIQPGADYDQYEPAYRYGYSSYATGREWDEIEPQLGQGWDRARGSRSRLDWANAKHATRDAWQRVKDRVEHAIPGDSDRDGK